MLLLGFGVSCSSDADEPETPADTEEGPSSTEQPAEASTTSVPEDAPTTTAPENANDLGTEEGSAEVTAYCEDVEEIARQLEEVRANPNQADVDSINNQLDELTQSATQLLEDHPDEVDRINSCAEGLLGPP